MKDIVITSKVISRELWVMLGCFVFAVGFDLVAIIIYERPVSEILSTLGYEVVLAGVVYVVLLIFRLIFGAIFRLTKRLFR